ncbi:MAG: DUF58 domain-containing protein [Pseudomonadota bacterium]
MQATLRLSQEAPERGVLTIANVALESTYPFGLFRSRLRLPHPTPCYIYPRPQGSLPLPRRGPLQNQPSKEDEETFDQLREYLPGEGLGRIAWKASARSEELLTKNFVDESNLPILSLDWDDATQADDEKRLSQLAAWVLETEELGQRYCLVTPQGNIPGGKGPLHRKRCLEHLARYPSQGQAS